LESKLTLGDHTKDDWKNLDIASNINEIEENLVAIRKSLERIEKQLGITS
jgi:hypothetical protein